MKSRTRKWLQGSAVSVCVATALFGLHAGGAAAQEVAVVKRATQLRDAPAASGAGIASLAASTVVTRLSERKGPWTRVTTSEGTSGWVHMFDLRPQGGAASGSGNAATSGLRGLGTLFGGSNTATTTATSTVGIRGLGAEDIAQAQPNLAAVDRAENLRVDGQQARRFAIAASLEPRSVAPLLAPARSAAGVGTGASGSSSNPSDPNFSPN
jgi:hypothetical protein